MEQVTASVIADEQVKEQVLNAAAISCLNCGQTLAGRYCAHCGQPSNTHRLSLHDILHDLWHSFTHTDIGFLKLVKELSYRPGYVIKAYAAGKRRQYFNPWTFFVLATALYVFTASWSGYLNTFDQASAEFELEVQKKAMEQMANIFENHLKLVNFLFIPLLGAITWFMFRKSGYNYAENLVFQAYVYGQTALAFCVLLVPVYLLFPKTLPVLNIGYTLFSMGYFMVAARQFFGNSWPKTIIKTLLVYLVNFLLLVIPVALYVGFLLKK